LVIPFLLLAAGVAAWRTDTQTWHQLRVAAFGATSIARDVTRGDMTSAVGNTDADAAFAGKGEIDVDGGLIRLFPLTYGEIEEVAFREGQTVRIGDVLLRIRNRAAALQVEEAKAGVTLAEIELGKAKRLPDDLRKQVELAELAVQGEERLLAVAQRNLEHLRSLGPQVSEDAVRNSRDATTVAQQRLDAKRLERDRLKARRPEEDVRAAETLLQRARTKLAEVIEDADRFVLRARVGGRIMRVNVSVGETFAAASRDPAFLLCPDKPWVVTCEIEQEFANRVQLGMEVEVRDDMTAERIAVGRVERISGVFAPRRQPVDDIRLHNDLRTMECTVLLTTSHERLRIGQQVRALFRAVPSRSKKT
jgi:multidrug resistance efflux pump